MNETQVLDAAPLVEDDSKIKVLSVRQLMWLRFKRNRLAVFGAIVLLFFYFMALFAGFLAPYDPRMTHAEHPAAPPQLPQVFDQDGRFHWPPFVYATKSSVDPKTFRRSYLPIDETRYPLRFFAVGEPYKLFGLIPADIHLFQVDEPAKVFLMGTDRNGRDLFSRVVYGAQVSLTVGLVGVTLSLVIGTILGIMSGFVGGFFDNTMQRFIDILIVFPLIPLWLALAAAVPPTWSSVQRFFAISIVLSLVTWGALARQVRGSVLALRETDYVRAARYANASTWRIITQHLMPNTMSHVLVIATLAIPAMILGETALSFLGLGIQPPMTSWGLLLNEAQQTRVLLQQPWLLLPGVFVVVAIIAFNFIGDGIRDAADPFSK
jgi:peptide/nickel transport system permease protein